MAKGDKKTTKPDEQPVEEKSAIAQKAGVGMGRQFEGEKIEKKDLDGEEVILVDFEFMPNKFKEGRETAILQIEVDSELRVCFIGGEVVVMGLKNLNKDEDLPGPVTFFKDKTQDGKRTYWTMK